MSDGWNSDEESFARQLAQQNLDDPAAPIVTTTWRGRGAGGGRRGRGAPNQRSNGAQQSRRGQPPPMVLRGPIGCAGRIIGRGGSTVRQITQDSGAEVFISENHEEVTATIYGTEDERERAKLIIEPMMVSSEKRYRRPSPPRREPSPKSYNYTNNAAPIDWKAAAEEAEEWRKQHLIELGPIIKDIYREHPDVTALTKSQINEWRKTHFDVEANNLPTGDAVEPPPPVPKPVLTFQQAFGDYPEIMEEIRKQNFTEPSPIQSQAWPAIMQGRDVIGIAQTGTGKTLAFLLPAFLHIEAQLTPRSERKGPNVLILAPTRELALQIQKEVAKYQYKNIKAVCIYGGVSKKDQIDKIQAGVEILIATPGRLNDLIDSDFVNMEAITLLVLDEADRMLDMGFEPQIRRSLTDVRGDRQTIMTSATWPSSVRRLAETYTKNAVQIVVGSLDLTAVHTVTQEIIIMDEENKFTTLMQFLKELKQDEKAIVFCGRRFTATWVSTDLALSGIDYRSIYGGLEQTDREKAVEDLQSGESNILIATDVASRGLDIEDVTYVINFDFPHAMEEYVHRIGRTGRAGKKGTSISYITRQDWGKAEELIGILEEANQEVPEELRDMSSRFKAMKERKDREGGDYGGRRGGSRGNSRGRRGNGFMPFDGFS